MSLKLKKETVCLFLLLLVCSVSGRAQGFLRAEGKKIVNEKGENVLLRGIGLGGWMLQEGYMLRINKEAQQHRIRERFETLIGAEQTRQFYERWLSGHTRKVDIDSLKAWGFNSVRLPMHYNLYTLPVEKEPVAGQNTWLEKGFAMTDSLLSWCKADQIYLILDLHAAPGGQGNDLNISDRDPSKPSLWESRDNQQKTIALWKKLAERYANESWIAGYDILNEPNWGFEDLANDKNGLREQKNIPLKELMMTITKAIREVDQKHIVIIEGNGWGNNYNGILPPWDSNMVLSFHKYWAYNDQASAAHILKARDQYNIPVWIGETGENSNVWYTEAIRLFEKNNIGWAWWPLKKIGVNNPIQIRSNPDYDQVISYLNDQGKRPEKSVALNGLMKLAQDIRLENAVVQRDVIDAMFRQPFSTHAIPFKANKITANTLLNAVDYDLGINGTAYFDKDTADYHVSTGKNTPGNRGHAYRNDGVDISKGSGPGYYVSSIEDGEWLQYTIDVAKKGLYSLKLNIASAGSGKVTLVLNGKPVGKSLQLQNTGGLEVFAPVELKGINLPAGRQRLRVLADQGGFNFSSLQLQREN